MKKLFTEYWQEFDLRYIKICMEQSFRCFILSFTGAGVWFWKCGGD